MRAGTERPDAEDTQRPISPQALLINFAAIYLVTSRTSTEIGLPASAAVSIAHRAGIPERSVRTALNRMVDRGLLSRVKTGRASVYFVTEQMRGTLHEGQERMAQRTVVRDNPDIRWVLLAFSLSSAAQRERHLLRSQLTWAGFGPLQGGLWIAPDPVELEGLLGDPHLNRFVQVFRAEPMPPTDIAAMAPSIWDLESLAQAYNRFIDRWSPAATEPKDPLIEQLTLAHSWLELVRRDPWLPRWCLPDDWPAEAAERIYRDRFAGIESPARRIAEELLPDAASLR